MPMILQLLRNGQGFRTHSLSCPVQIKNPKAHSRRNKVLIFVLFLISSSIDTSLIPSFVSLGNCRTLSSLSFHDCLLDTEGLRQLLIILRRCPAITSLDLGNNCIDASALPLLADFLGTLLLLSSIYLDDVLTVRSIDITGVGMSPQQADLFAQLAASSDCDIAVTVDPS